MFLKTLLHPHKNYIAGIECIILGKLNLLVAIFLEVGRGHVNSIPSQVLSKKFTCMCRCESATLFLWNTVWLTFLRCLFITKLVMEYIWITHTELTVGKLVWFLDCSSTIPVISTSLNYFCKLNSFKVFQQLISVRQYQFSSTTSVYT